MSNNKSTDNLGVPRHHLNIREATFLELDRLRLEVEPGKKESWDRFFLRMLREGKLKK